MNKLSIETKLFIILFKLAQLVKFDLAFSIGKSPYLVILISKYLLTFWNYDLFYDTRGEITSLILQLTDHLVKLFIISFKLGSIS